VKRGAGDGADSPTQADSFAVRAAARPKIKKKNKNANKFADME
jgi:hypothetical protein